MPLNRVAIGAFQAIYVADAPSGDFIEVTTITTGDQTVSTGMDEIFSYSKNNTIQAGPRRITCEITFLGDDPVINYLANGNSLETTLVADASSAFQNYSLLLIAGDSSAPSSLYIPTCHTTKKYELPLSKTKASQLSLTFSHQVIDRSVQLYYKRDVDTLIDILGGRSPI